MLSIYPITYLNYLLYYLFKLLLAYPITSLPYLSQ